MTFFFLVLETSVSFFHLRDETETHLFLVTGHALSHIIKSIHETNRRHKIRSSKENRLFLVNSYWQNNFEGTFKISLIFLKR